MYIKLKTAKIKGLKLQLRRLKYYEKDIEL